MPPDLSLTVSTMIAVTGSRAGEGVDETLYDASVRAWRPAESARETQRGGAPGTEPRLGKVATVHVRWGIALRAPVQGMTRHCGSVARAQEVR